MNDMLHVENVTKRYLMGGKWLDALNGVTLSFSRGEIVCVIGPSGAGKSTLLHLLGLIDTPSSGHIMFEDRKINALSSREKAAFRSEHLGFIFQSFYLLPELNCLQNVCLPAFIKDRKSFWKKEKVITKARNMLERVGLKERLGHKPSELSGGEMQRAAICRSLINDPTMVLADEPTGNLDSKNSDIVADLLLSLARDNNTTLIIATHNETLARRADKIVKLVDGKVTEVRTTK
jgi:lipoprotein-releasing system ATP-binding protein